LQYRAGIPSAEWFGLHNLRKTIASLLWETSPQAATLALGHVSGVTTVNHYVNPTAIVTTAMDGIEAPWKVRLPEPAVARVVAVPRSAKAAEFDFLL
jgi:integrase